MWMGYTEADARFPDLGTGGAPTGGTVYRYDEDSDSTTKFPRFYDGQWFIGEWNNDWIKTATWNDDGPRHGRRAASRSAHGYISPMDIEFGPDGSMYVVEWGQRLRREQPGLGRLPGRLRPGLAAADRAGERHAGRRPRAAGRGVLRRRLA